jgi:hypothetical protein
MRRATVSITTAIAIAAAGAAGCATTGFGSGRVAAPGKPEAEGEASFRWRAEPDATRGTINAVLPDGRIFRGSFLQVVSTTVAQDLDPYWSAWGGPWHGWGYSGIYNDTMFVRHYTGRVIAQLTGPEGERMRCRFVLARPEDGPASGGVGDCELSSGETIEYAALRGEDH